jgi:ferritin-like metal-binding protein YciE
LSNPRDLLLQWLGELVWIERMLAFQVLPALIETVSDEKLKGGLERHLHETREQAQRAGQAFRALGLEPSSNRSAPLEALAKQHDELAGSFTDPRLRDVFNAAAAGATERLELALYVATIELGQAMGVSGEAIDLLRESCKEEKRALETVERERKRLAGEATG